MRVHRAHIGVLTNGQTFQIFLRDGNEIAKVSVLERRFLGTSRIVDYLRPDDAAVASAAELAESPVGMTPDRETIMHIFSLVEKLEAKHERGAPVETVIEQATDEGVADVLVEKAIADLKQTGEIYAPTRDHIRTS